MSGWSLGLWGWTERPCHARPTVTILPQEEETTEGQASSTKIKALLVRKKGQIVNNTQARELKRNTPKHCLTETELFPHPSTPANTMAFTVCHLSESPHHSSSSSSQNLGFIHDTPLVFIPISSPRASPVYPPLDYLNSFTSPSSPSNSCSCLLLNYCNIFPSALVTPQSVLQAKRLLFSDSVMSDSVTPRTVACQAPLSMIFSRQEYWSGLPFPFQNTNQSCHSSTPGTRVNLAEPLANYGRLIPLDLDWFHCGQRPARDLFLVTET